MNITQGSKDVINTKFRVVSAINNGFGVSDSGLGNAKLVVQYQIVW